MSIEKTAAAWIKALKPTEKERNSLKWHLEQPNTGMVAKYCRKVEKQIYQQLFNE